MPIAFKIIVLAVLAMIVVSLGQGMFHLAKGSGDKDQTRVVKALTVRISLSLLLFAILIGGYFFGLIGAPHS